MAANDLPAGAGDLASAVGVGGQRPAQLVQQDVVVPVTVVLEVGEAGAAAVPAVPHMVRFAAGGGLVAAAELIATLNHPSDFGDAAVRLPRPGAWRDRHVSEPREHGRIDGRDRKNRSSASLIKEYQSSVESPNN